MFVTKKFISRLKRFLISIDVSLDDSISKEKIEKAVFDLMPLALTTLDIKELATDYRFFKARFKRVIKVFYVTQHKQVYDNTNVNAPFNFSTDNDAIGTVVMTNFLTNRHGRYQLFYNEPKRISLVKALKGFYRINPYSPYKVKNTLFGFDIYQNDTLKYSYKYSIKKGNVSFSTKQTLLLEKDANTYIIKDQTRIEDQIIGQFEMLSDIRPGFSFSKVSATEQEELVTLVALGAMISSNVKEIQRSAAA